MRRGIKESRQKGGPSGVSEEGAALHLLHDHESPESPKTSAVPDDTGDPIVAHALPTT